MKNTVRLNLGCGENRIPGYVNVDKYGRPDVVHDLEMFPWPWEDNSVEEVVLCHVLEHLGETSEAYLGVVKELYRVCVPGARISITVPHPRHDEFLSDPTHVRAVTPESLSLFSKRLNREWIGGRYANSPLGLYLDVDLELEKVEYTPDDSWSQALQSGRRSESDLMKAMRKYNNVMKEIRMVLRVVKPE